MMCHLYTEDWVKWYLVVLSMWLVTATNSAVPSPPSNLSLTEILSHTVMVTWEADIRERITIFEMTIQPLSESSSRTFKAHLDGGSRQFLVSPLYPETEYELYIAAHNTDGISNSSDIITFRTPMAPDDFSELPSVHPAEALIVTFILLAWFAAIGFFLQEWGKLRILPEQPRYNHSPKNIETIKVVKHSTDSVIHKSYSIQHKNTMVAREKRLARMNTMPNIKVNLEDLKEKPNVKDTNDVATENQKYKAFSRRITSPVFELDETGGSYA